MKVFHVVPFALALGALLASPAARASDVPLFLEWHAAEGCPSRESAIEAIDALLGHEPPGDRAPLRARADLVADGAGGFRAEVRGVSADARVLRGATCREVFDAAVIVLALAVDPTLGAAPPPPPRPTPAPPPTPPPSPSPEARSDPAPPALRLFVSGAWVLDAGSLPSLASGPSIAAGIRVGRTWLEGQGTYLLPQDAASAERASEGGTFSQLRVGGRACHALLDARWAIGPCASLSVEWTRAQGFGAEQPASVVGTSVVAAAGGTARLRIAPALGLRADLDAAVPFGRPSYVIENTGVVHRSAAVVGRADLGIELHFP